MLFSLLFLALPQSSSQPELCSPESDRVRGGAMPPNMLVIVADDLGTDLLRIYDPYYPGTPTSPPAPPTPALDWLAEEGMVFTDCWTCPSCSPTRAQILTGLYAQRSGVGGIVFAGGTEPGLDHSEELLPQFLRKADPSYTSAAVGKWHLAESDEYGDWSHALGPRSNPWFELWAGSLFNLRTGQGTDYNQWEKTFATPIDAVLDEYRAPQRFPGRVLLDESTSSAPSPAEYATVDTIDDAVHLVGTLPEPWLLYVAFNAPHIPVTSPSAPLGVSSCQGFTTDPTCALTGSELDERVRCMTQWMDNEVGRLLCDLDQEGLDERTVVMFIGDNGTVGDTMNNGVIVPGAILAPFTRNHGKRTMYQGGVNVPLIVRGPGIRRGVSHELVSSTDLVATLAEIAGAPDPNNLVPDSVSFAPCLYGSDARIRRTVFVDRFDPNFTPRAGEPPPGYEPTRHFRAIRDANFKLIRRELAKDDGSVEIEEQFFDLRRPSPGAPQADPFELHDLRPQITPGGSSPLDRAYAALLREMQANHPSLFERGGTSGACPSPTRRARPVRLGPYHAPGTHYARPARSLEGQN